jgi:hypothetical protein
MKGHARDVTRSWYGRTVTVRSAARSALCRSASLRLRVRLSIRLDELRGVDVRIALRRGEASVAEQFLNGPQVRSPLEEVGGKGMPKRVRTDPEPRAAGSNILSDQPIDAARRQAPPLLVE